MNLYKLFMMAVFCALFVFGTYKLATDNDVNSALKEKLVEKSTERPIIVSIFAKSLDELTPTFSYKLPFTSKKIFMVNEFLYYEFSHVLFTLMLFVIAGFIMHIYKFSAGKQIIVFLLLIIIGYYIASFLLYGLYHYSANQIGYTFAEAELFRREYSNNYDNVLLPSIMAAIFALLSIGKSMFTKVRK